MLYMLVCYNVSLQDRQITEVYKEGKK